MRYPDMKLYQEIILLKEFFRGLYCVENVVAYYEPLIPPIEYASHYFWTNFSVSTNGIKSIYRGIGGKNKISIKLLEKMKGFDSDKLIGLDKELVLRNCVEPESGKHILDCAINSPSLFEEKPKEVIPLL